MIKLHSENNIQFTGTYTEEKVRQRLEREDLQNVRIWLRIWFRINDIETIFGTFRRWKQEEIPTESIRNSKSFSNI